MYTAESVASNRNSVRYYNANRTIIIYGCSNLPATFVWNRAWNPSASLRMALILLFEDITASERERKWSKTFSINSFSLLSFGVSVCHRRTKYIVGINLIVVIMANSNNTRRRLLTDNFFHTYGSMVRFDSPVFLGDDDDLQGQEIWRNDCLAKLIRDAFADGDRCAGLLNWHILPLKFGAEDCEGLLIQCINR